MDFPPASAEKKRLEDNGNLLVEAKHKRWSDHQMRSEKSKPYMQPGPKSAKPGGENLLAESKQLRWSHHTNDEKQQRGYAKASPSASRRPSDDHLSECGPSTVACTGKVNTQARHLSFKTNDDIPDTVDTRRLGHGYMQASPLSVKTSDGFFDNRKNAANVGKPYMYMQSSPMSVNTSDNFFENASIADEHAESLEKKLQNAHKEIDELRVKLEAAEKVIREKELEAARRGKYTARLYEQSKINERLLEQEKVTCRQKQRAVIKLGGCWTLALILWTAALSYSNKPKQPCNLDWPFPGSHDPRLDSNTVAATDSPTYVVIDRDLKHENAFHQDTKMVAEVFSQNAETTQNSAEKVSKDGFVTHMVNESPLSPPKTMDEEITTSVGSAAAIIIARDSGVVVDFMRQSKLSTEERDAMQHAEPEATQQNRASTGESIIARESGVAVDFTRQTRLSSEESNALQHSEPEATQNDDSPGASNVFKNRKSPVEKEQNTDGNNNAPSKEERAENIAPSPFVTAPKTPVFGLALCWSLGSIIIWALPRLSSKLTTTMKANVVEKPTEHDNPQVAVSTSANGSCVDALKYFKDTVDNRGFIGDRVPVARNPKLPLPSANAMDISASAASSPMFFADRDKTPPTAITSNTSYPVPIPVHHNYDADGNHSGMYRISASPAASFPMHREEMRESRTVSSIYDSDSRTVSTVRNGVATQLFASNNTLEVKTGTAPSHCKCTAETRKPM